MNYKKLYFGLVSIASLLAFLIPFTISSKNILEKVIISDKEYALNNYIYKYCSNYEYYNKYGEHISIRKSGKNVASCQEKAIKKSIEDRNYIFKKDLLESISWIVIFSIVFGFHYKSFRKED